MGQRIQKEDRTYLFTMFHLHPKMASSPRNIYFILGFISLFRYGNGQANKKIWPCTEGSTPTFKMCESPSMPYVTQPSAEVDVLAGPGQVACSFSVTADDLNCASDSCTPNKNAICDKGDTLAACINSGITTARWAYQMTVTYTCVADAPTVPATTTVTVPAADTTAAGSETSGPDGTADPGATEAPTNGTDPTDGGGSSGGIDSDILLYVILGVAGYVLVMIVGAILCCLCCRKKSKDDKEAEYADPDDIAAEEEDKKPPEDKKDENADDGNTDTGGGDDNPSESFNY